MSKRQMAAILGQIRANLMAFPFLRAFTSSLASFLKLHCDTRWDTKFPIPGEVKIQLQEVRGLLSTWTGRPLRKNLQEVCTQTAAIMPGWST